MLDDINAIEKNKAEKGNREKVWFCSLNRMVRGGVTAEETYEWELLEMVQELWIWDRRTHSRVNSKCKGPEARVCLECCRNSKEPGMTRVKRRMRRVVDGIRATLSGDLADDYKEFGFHISSFQERKGNIWQSNIILYAVWTKGTKGKRRSLGG